MKNFQDWLDCQLYSSHLKNLTKIKQSSLYMKSSSANRRQLKTATNCRNITFLDSSESRHESKVRPHNVKVQMRENQIAQENFNLASRLINVSSVISKEKQVQSYRRYQSLFKKNSNNKRIQFFKARKLKNFLKVSEDNYVNGIHKAIIKMTFLSLPRVPQGNSPTIWLELYSGTQKVISSHYSYQDILFKQVKLPMKRKVDKNLVLKLNCSRGLTYINLGQYYFEAPKKDTCREYADLISHQDSRKFITMTVQIEELIKHEKHSSLKIR